MAKRPPKAVTLPNGLKLETIKNWYTGLWEVRYADGGPRPWAGPFKTQREALGKMQEALDE